MKNSYTLWIFFVVLILLPWSKFSYADWGEGQHAGHHGEHQYYHYRDHPRYGLHVDRFYPDEYFPVLVGGARYYYDDGIYYNYSGGDYVVMSPPVGAVVSTIPSDFKPTVINGATYYTNNGTYYVYTPSGYKVISPPVPQAVPAVDNSLTVNVPRDKGGYATITLRRSGNGFVGPQGEFYPAFPKISRLQAIYGR